MADKQPPSWTRRSARVAVKKEQEEKTVFPTTVAGKRKRELSDTDSSSSVDSISSGDDSSFAGSPKRGKKKKLKSSAASRKTRKIDKGKGKESSTTANKTKKIDKGKGKVVSKTPDLSTSRDNKINVGPTNLRGNPKSAAAGPSRGAVAGRKFATPMPHRPRGAIGGHTLETPSRQRGQAFVTPSRRQFRPAVSGRYPVPHSSNRRNIAVRNSIEKFTAVSDNPLKGGRPGRPQIFSSGPGYLVPVEVSMTAMSSARRREVMTTYSLVSSIRNGQYAGDVNEAIASTGYPPQVTRPIMHEIWQQQVTVGLTPYERSRMLPPTYGIAAPYHPVLHPDNVPILRQPDHPGVRPPTSFAQLVANANQGMNMMSMRVIPPLNLPGGQRSRASVRTPDMTQAPDSARMTGLSQQPNADQVINIDKRPNSHEHLAGSQQLRASVQTPNIDPALRSAPMAGLSQRPNTNQTTNSDRVQSAREPDSPSMSPTQKQLWRLRWLRERRAATSPAIAGSSDKFPANNVSANNVPANNYSANNYSANNYSANNYSANNYSAIMAPASTGLEAAAGATIIGLPSTSAPTPAIGASTSMMTAPAQHESMVTSDNNSPLPMSSPPEPATATVIKLERP